MTDKPLACPACGCLQSIVLWRRQTLALQLLGGYRRRRQCGACGHQFPTKEVVADDEPA